MSAATVEAPGLGSRRPLRIGIVGCGNIAQAYATSIGRHAEIALIGATDVNHEARAAFCAAHGCQDYADLETLLADPAVDIVVNLTSHAHHHAVSRQALEAGKHVCSEKPLALTSADAADLIDVAAAHGVRLACAPSLWLGPAMQTAWHEVATARIGRVRMVYANVDHGRIESWHPAPGSFYEVGPVFDVAVYPIAQLAVMLGPIREVRAIGDVLMPERRSKTGDRFSVAADDHVTAVMTHADGTRTRLSCSFYVEATTSTGEGIEFHGDDGTLLLKSWVAPRCSLAAVSPTGGDREDVALIDPDAETLRADERKDVDFGLGLVDLARAGRGSPSPLLGRARRARGGRGAGGAGGGPRRRDGRRVEHVPGCRSRRLGNTLGSHAAGRPGGLGVDLRRLRLDLIRELSPERLLGHRLRDVECDAAWVVARRFPRVDHRALSCLTVRQPHRGVDRRRRERRSDSPRRERLAQRRGGAQVSHAPQAGERLVQHASGIRPDRSGGVLQCVEGEPLEPGMLKP